MHLKLRGTNHEPDMKPSLHLFSSFLESSGAVGHKMMGIGSNACVFLWVNTFI